MTNIGMALSAKSITDSQKGRGSKALSLHETKGAEETPMKGLSCMMDMEWEVQLLPCSVLTSGLHMLAFLYKHT